MQWPFIFVRGMAETQSPRYVQDDLSFSRSGGRASAPHAEPPVYIAGGALSEILENGKIKILKY